MYLTLTDSVHSVGVYNPNMRIFDIVMETKNGTSYNAYLVKGGKTALIEASHSTFCEDFLTNIRELCPIEQIDYLVLNHTEPDHSGCVGRLLELNPDLTVVATAAGLKNIKAITGKDDFRSITAKDGETLSLGTKTLRFIIAPNLHWPDSMFTYLEEEQVLFPCDFMGAHYCELRGYDDAVVYPRAYEEALSVYYQAIMSPFRTFVQAGLEKIKNLPLKLVCPSHGPVLRSTIKEAIDKYRQWSTPHAPGKNAAIFYVSAYGYTKMMAEHLQRALKEKGIDAQCYNIIAYDIAVLKEKLEEAGAVLLGSPTINRDALKPVWDLLSVTDAVLNKGKPTAVFGSYGWSGEACGMLIERLNGLKLQVLCEPVKANFLPKAAQFTQLDEMAARVAAALEK